MNNVVKLYKEGAIGIVVIEEREYKNTFSKRFINGLVNTFAEIKKDYDIKIVVVHGYDNYFCCGGTKEELLNLYEGIQKGTSQFTDMAFVSDSENSVDLSFYDIFLQCEIPVIAAMQGHALGGGLAFGCYADIIVMGEQCIYNANFMKYGFTPGLGATYIIPKKIGELLGNEMLFSAKNYYGAELKERGAQVKIVKKEIVIDTAMELATELSEKPTLSLITLKENLVHKIRSELPAAIERELEMHRRTFSQPEVRERIESLFGN